jgi:dTMP kinase
VANNGSYAGLLLAFEGPDSGSRPRAVEAVRNMLEAHGRQVLVSRWMGSALAGEVYRQSAPLYELSPRTLALLAACDLAERMEWEILPALQAGAVVLADRYLYRVALGSARDVDADWLEVLCGAGPVPDAVLHFPLPLGELVANIDPTRLDLYEAGMDIGMTHDLPLSYRFYQERLLDGYAEWAERHGVPIEDMPSVEAAVARVEELLELSGAPLRGRRLAVLGLLEEIGTNPNHARQVARLARRLFELTAPQHRLGPGELELLEHACLLHDIGGGNLGEEHPSRSAHRVKESRLEGFNPDELDTMAVLIAIHRASDEQSAAEEWLRALSADDQRKVFLLGPLLRLADGLDTTRKQSVRDLDATVHDGLLDLVLRSKDKARPEVKAAIQRADLFEQAYGLHLSIEVRRKGPPPAGAELAPTELRVGG